ncbi:MAG TPA: hypothetical protein VHW67_04245, partial [Solirubrobacteraceae bacterium]|nr:hypothetical protein [Solirubrobacteraceae bacterium]
MIVVGLDRIRALAQPARIRRVDSSITRFNLTEGSRLLQDFDKPGRRLSHSAIAALSGVTRLSVYRADRFDV